MLPKAKSLIDTLSQDGDNCKFYNNDADADLGDVLKTIFGEELPEPCPLRCSDGEVRTFTFDE